MTTKKEKRERGAEWQYRKGFRHGVAEAARLVLWMGRRGYVRSQEISNMLAMWADHDLMQWQCGTAFEQPLKWDGHPELKWRPWADIKNAAHERDGWQCTQCGSADNLEAHHIEPVAEGGLPELDNLTTLCKECHRG